MTKHCSGISSLRVDVFPSDIIQSKQTLIYKHSPDCMKQQGRLDQHSCPSGFSICDST